MPRSEGVGDSKLIRLKSHKCSVGTDAPLRRGWRPRGVFDATVVHFREEQRPATKGLERDPRIARQSRGKPKKAERLVVSPDNVTVRRNH